VRPIELIIFDFDGVVADSELLANTALADYLTRKGKPTTVDDSIRLFMGKRMADTRIAAEAWLGRPLPDDFETDYRDETREMMRRDVKAVRGVDLFLAQTTGVARCVASSSMHGWLDHCVDKFGFRDHFGRSLYSATEVANGKPAPDIFLHAAARMGVAPDRARTARRASWARKPRAWKRSASWAGAIFETGMRHA
jgi:beta-phosphoglucomutase-like phosphatase (HAD superfamily)